MWVNEPSSRARAHRVRSRQPLVPEARRKYIAAFVLAILLGIGISGPLQQLVVDTLAEDYSTPTWDSALLWTQITLLAVGTFAIQVGSGADDIQRRHLGAMESSDRSAAVVLAGVSIGLTAALTLTFPRFRVVGSSSAVITGDPRVPWNIFDWIGYTMQWWLPVVLVLVTIGSFRHSRRIEAHNAELSGLRDRLIRQGSLVRGTVVEKIVKTSTHEGSQTVHYYARVDFRDLTGRAHQVTRPIIKTPGVDVGSPAWVLFAPWAPDSDRLTFVSFHPQPTASDWLPLRGTSSRSDSEAAPRFAAISHGHAPLRRF